MRLPDLLTFAWQVVRGSLKRHQAKALMGRRVEHDGRMGERPFT